MARRFAVGLPKRVAIIFLVMVACAGVLWLRLGYLQILRHPFLEAEALRQRYRSHQLVPDRGAVLDRNGIPLAVTVYGHGVYAVPGAVGDPNHAAEDLSRLLGRSGMILKAQLTRRSSSVWLADRLDQRTAAAIENLKLLGVYVVERPQRELPPRLDGRGRAGLHRP